MDSMTASGITAGADGGLLYSNPNTISLTTSITNSHLTGITSISLGSMISLRKGPTTPSLALTVASSYFSCQTTDMESTIAALGSVITNLDLATPVASIGGAFYFEATTSTSTVTSSSNTFYNCYTAGSGAIFYLPSGLTMTDLASTFK